MVAQPPKPTAITEKPALKIVIEPKAVTASASTKLTDQSPKAGSLDQYAQLTQKYYLARRCNVMTYGEISSLYKNVVSTHTNVVANFGVAAVRGVMQKSEARAKSGSCS